MISLTCTSEHNPDGSFIVRSDPTWRFARPNEAHLEGEHAELWEAIRGVAALAPEQQRAVLSSLSAEARLKVVKLASLLQKKGFVRLDSGLAARSADLPDELPGLSKLHLEITNRCNYACRACYLGGHLRRAADRDVAEGTREDWLGLIRAAGRLGCGFATVTGGEPFLRPDCLDLVEALSDQGILVEINTNASPVTAPKARRLKDLLISTVAVSLYGHDGASAAAYTGNGSAFAATMRGVRNLVDHEVPLTVKYFATRGNYAGFGRVQEILEPLGISARLIGHAIHGDLFEGRPADPEVAETGLPVVRVVQETSLPCYPTIHGLGIEPDGTVRACPKLTVYFGNVFEEGLEALWLRSAELAAFRDFWVHHCAAHGYVLGAEQGSLCPAARLLSRSGGLAELRRSWEQWPKEA